ncbi:MAG: glycoside hydrolase family 3 protein, partial [Fulvivirga sp.]|nr:glycoside hydrolase family 3 protein [Fulvivirga sp.]
MIKKVFSAILFCFYFVLSAYAQQNLAKTAWVDSVFSSLSLNEKIGQLFMVAAYSGGNEQHYQVIDQLVKKHHIGGLIFMQGHPHSQASLTNRYQRHAEVPLLIAQDAEWGLGMRLDSTLSYPKQMTLGAIEEDSLIYQMGAEVARQLKLLGVHINLAPVADINNNPQNPVIGDRSFGEDKKIVSQKAIAYMKGMQDNGIIACAKHFPGHGDTNKDSHVTLPVIKHKDSRLQQVELYPFKKLINAGVKSIMTAHLQVNAYDKKMPSSLSEKITTQLLKEEMGFNGLVISDALNMKAVADDHENVELEALRAGNDILLFSQDVPGAVRSIKKALRRKKISRSQFNSSVKQVLAAKFEAGLHNYVPANTDNVTLKLNRPEAELLRQK